MNQRGRKSAASLEVVNHNGVTELRRPDAPLELTPEQAEEWRMVAGSLPADWFPRETWGMLAQYCRHVVSARRVGQLIDSLMDREDFDVTDYDKLLKMQERESRSISSLATRMRVSQQSSYDKSKSKGKKNFPVPWE